MSLGASEAHEKIRFAASILNRKQKGSKSQEKLKVREIIFKQKKKGPKSIK